MKMFLRTFTRIFMIRSTHVYRDLFAYCHKDVRAEFRNQRNLGLLRPISVSNDPAGTTYHVSSGIRCRHAHENLVIKVVYGVLPRILSPQAKLGRIRKPVLLAQRQIWAT